MSYFTNNNRRFYRTVTSAVGAVAIVGSVAAATPAMAVTRPAAMALTAAAMHEAGVIPFTTASVTQNSDGSWTVSYTAPGVSRVAIYVGNSDTKFGSKAVIARGASASVTVTTSAARPWVKLVPDHGSPLVVASRPLGLTGVLNARDAGGYRTTDGQWVKDGLVYRTAALTPTASDLTELDSLGISNVYDLRTTAEIDATPDTVPAGATWTNLNVLGGATLPSTAALTSAAAAEQYMEDVEVQMVDSSSAKTSYAALLNGIADDSGAVVYHCTAGKDRTGWGTAVLLLLLGVPEQTVMSDYLLSNEYYLDSASIQAELAAMPAAEAAIYEPMLAVEPEYLQAGLDQVNTEYGSIYNYVTKGLGVSPATVAKLREKLLEGTPQH